MVYWMQMVTWEHKQLFRNQTQVSNKKYEPQHVISNNVAFWQV